MPLRPKGESFELVCVNHDVHSKGEASTMARVPDWATFPKATPKSVDLSISLPVTVFSCSKCGYLEMYSARITDPETWKSNG